MDHDAPGALDLATAIRADRRVRADVFWERWIDVGTDQFMLGLETGR